VRRTSIPIIPPCLGVFRRDGTVARRGRPIRAGTITSTGNSGSPGANPGKPLAPSPCFARGMLWPQPYPDATAEDKVENARHWLVCHGRLDLGVVQRGIAKSWGTEQEPQSWNSLPIRPPIIAVHAPNTIPPTNPAATLRPVDDPSPLAEAAPKPRKPTPNPIAPPIFAPFAQ
jgi:hypothetical protein